MDRPAQPVQGSSVESVARNLVALLQQHINDEARSPASPTVPLPVTLPVPLPVPTPRPAQTMMQNEMQRSFPGFFKGKRRQPFFQKAVPASKALTLQINAMPAPVTVTPKGEDELKFCQAGLGLQTVAFPENATHQQITEILENSYPKLKTLNGAWLFYKSAGGSGRRKLSVISPQMEGYSAPQLRRASNNGKCIIYVVPLQGELDTSPLSRTAAEYAKMPKATCSSCKEAMPLHLLALHIESCTSDDSNNEHEDTEPEMGAQSLDSSMTACPICNKDYPIDLVEIHANNCIASLSDNDDVVSLPSPRSSTSAGHRSPQPSTSAEHTSLMPSTSAGHTSLMPSTSAGHTSLMPSTSAGHTSPRASTSGPSEAGWRTVPDPKKALRLFTEELLELKKHCPENYLAVDVRTGHEEQDRAYISFYKRSNMEWAAPLKCRLEGDAAVGVGVRRHVMSMVMQKLRMGFSLNLGNGPTTKIFEGQTNHLVPTNSAVMLESDLFLMAGRMLGHCILYGGPPFPGLSPAIKHVLCGGSVDTATVTIEDCPDLDIRDTIEMLTGNGELPESDRESIVSLCLAWDLPPPTQSNRKWLHDKMLMHAVLTRSSRKVKQLRKGLKDTGIWPLLSNRPDVMTHLFPSENEAKITPQMILPQITWPSVDVDPDEDDDDLSVECISRVTGFLRRFIENASSDQLKLLLRFWIGWEVPPTVLVIKMAEGSLPRASTCFETLKVPHHYLNYEDFENDMMAAISSCDNGFGLV